MPEQLSDFDFGSRQQYDWDTLLDGHVWRIPLSEIASKPRSFITRAAKAANKANKQLRSSVQKDDSGAETAVVIQAY